MKMLSKPIRILAFSGLVAMLTPAAASAQQWQVDYPSSSLTFEVQQAGNPLKGQFRDWSSEISFDPNAPQDAEIVTRIQMSSAATGNGQIDNMLPGQQWFDTSSFPQAEFRSSSVRKLQDGSFEADGELTLRGLTQPVQLTFTMEITNDKAFVAGTTKLNRTNFEIGNGVDPNSVEEFVSVSFSIQATKPQ